MAEYTITHKGNGEVYHRLDFMGRTFDSTMKPCKMGHRIGFPLPLGEKSFKGQVQEAFPDISEDILCAIEELTFDDDSARKSTILLTEYEREEF